MARTLRRLLVALSVAACALSALPAARAQGNPADKATARSLAIEGDDALKRKDFTAAADRFSRADSLFPAPTLKLGLARARVGLRQLVAAQEGYRRILQEPLPPDASKQFIEAIDDAKRELAALEPRIPWITIQVVGPREPEATVDGTPLPPASIGVRRAIDPGTHAVRVAAVGFVPVDRSFTVNEGASEIVTLTLIHDGSMRGGPSAGPRPGSPPNAPPATPRRKSALVPIGTVGVVIGVVGVVAGAVTGVLAMREHTILEDECDNDSCPEDRRKTLDNFRTLATVSTVGFVGGGIAGLGGLTLIVLAPSSTPSASGALVQARGTF